MGACPNCGGAVEPGAVYCETCGAYVGDNSPTTTVDRSARLTGSQPVGYDPYGESRGVAYARPGEPYAGEPDPYQQDLYQQDSYQQPQKDRSFGIPALVTLLAVAILALAGFTWLLFVHEGGGSTKPNAGSAASTSQSDAGAGLADSGQTSTGDGSSQPSQQAPSQTWETSLPPGLQSCVGEEPDAAQYGTSSAGGVHCSFAQSVYLSYQAKKGSDGSASFDITNPEMHDDRFSVSCDPVSGYIECHWLNVTRQKDTGSKEYILGP